EDVEGGLAEVVQTGGARPRARRDAAPGSQRERDGARDDDLEHDGEADERRERQELARQQANPPWLADEQVAHRPLAVLAREGPGEHAQSDDTDQRADVDDAVD